MRREERCGHRAGLGHPLEPSVTQSSLCSSSALGPSSSAAAFGLRSGDSRVFNQSSGTRDSPAYTSRPRGEALLWAGTAKGCPVSLGLAERPPRSSCTSSLGAPAPALSHTHTPRWARPAFQQPQPSACGSSALLEIIASFSSSSSSSCCFYNLLLSPVRAPRGICPSLGLALRPPSPKALPFTAGVRAALPWSLPGAGPVLNVSLAATSPSLWTWAGLGREWRGEARRGPPDPQGWLLAQAGTAGGSRFAPSHHLTSI